MTERLHPSVIDCPVEWCAGHPGDHGAFGDAPEVWLHSTAGLPLAPGVELWRDRVGTHPERWTLTANGAEVATAATRHELADQLRTLADRVVGDPQ